MRMKYYLFLKFTSNFIKLFSLIKKKIFQIIYVLKFLILNTDYGKYKKEVLNFEDGVRKQLSSDYSITFSSATAAFDSLIISLNLPKKAKVLTTELIFNTFYLNLLSHNLTLEIIQLDENFQIPNNYDLSQEKCDLIIITHPFGIIKKFEILRKFAKKNKIKIIEDCSHAIGGKINLKNVGSESDYRIFSIGGKIISGGEGGVLLTNNKDSYNKIISISHPFRKNFQLNIKNEFYLRFSSPKKYRINPINVVLALYDFKRYHRFNFSMNKIINNLNKYMDHLNNESNFIKYIKIERNVEFGGFYYGYPIIIYKKNIYEKLLQYPDIFLNYPWIEYESLKSIKFFNNEFVLEKVESNKTKKNYYHLFINYKYLKYNYLGFKIFLNYLINDSRS